MKGPRRTGTWVGAGIFAVLAVCLLLVLLDLFIGLNNLHPGAEDVYYPPGQTPPRVGIHLVEVCLVAGSTVLGLLFGAVHNLDASPPGRALAMARGAFFGGLLLAIGAFALFFLTVFTTV